MPHLNIKQLLRRPSRRDCVFLFLGGTIALAIVGTVHFIQVRQPPLKPQSAGMAITWLPSTVRRWKDPINEMAKKYNIDPDLLAIIMTLESGGYSKASSNADAKGLMQITPATAKDIASKYLKTPQTNYDLQDPRTNIEFGTAYLAMLRKEFGEASQGPDWNTTVELIAAGYNGGPSAANSVYKGQGLKDTQTVVYSRDAFNMWRERRASESPTYSRWLERGGQTLVDVAKAEK